MRTSLTPPLVALLGNGPGLAAALVGWLAPLELQPRGLRRDPQGERRASPRELESDMEVSRERKRQVSP
jgi:hypothetical protein